MPSLAWFCTTGPSLLSPFSLLSVLLCLHVGVQGATLWEPHWQGDDSDTFPPASRTPPQPSAAMLQALEHIQRLSQQAARTSAPDSVDAGDDLGDVERVRAMLRLDTPARTSRGEEDERAGQQEREEDNTPQWIEAVLSTLQQASEPVTPQEAAHAARGHSVTPHAARGHSVTPHAATRLLFSLSAPPRPTQEQDTQGNAVGIQRHDRKFPLLFEDKGGQDQPLKRTNENAEEQYTPQKLATLQSVFEELSRIANSKAYNKRHNAEDDDSDTTNEDYDWYREKKSSFEDGKGEEELTPLEEQTELEEEEPRRHQFTGGLGDHMDEEGEEASDREGGEADEAKRSNQSDLLQMEKEEEPDDVSRLVDYYLFKVLEKTEQEQQKREEVQEKDEEEEEEDNEEAEGSEDEDEQRGNERRAAQLWYQGDSQPLYQLIKMSHKFKIPPEDIVDLLESEESKKPDWLWQRMQGQSQRAPLRYPSPLGPHKNPASALYRRPPQAQGMSPVTQDILRILGLPNTAQPGNKSFRRPNQSKPASAPSYPLMERELPDYAASESGREQSRADYDDAVDPDGLASYLVAELLVQRQRRSSPALELAIREFLDDPGMSVPEQGQAERKKTAEDSDEDTLLGILQYLNLDSDDMDESDLNEKTVPGM